MKRAKKNKLESHQKNKKNQNKKQPNNQNRNFKGMISHSVFKKT